MFIFSKNVVFGCVVSGQSVVDAVVNVATDAETERPLKDIIIAHCGELDNNSSKKT